MTQLSNSYFTKGVNSTVLLPRGVGLSYQSTGVAIYNSTEIDRWSIGDFVSVEYIINAEFGLNQRETIHATLVAMPGQSSITIYGRTTLVQQLINVRASATNSYATLIVEPASVSVQGVVVTFFGNYAKSSQQLATTNSAATANLCSWSSASNVTSLTITVDKSRLTGVIAVGQRVTGTGIPTSALVKSWNPVTGILVIGSFQSSSFTAATTRQLTFSDSPTQLINATQTIEPARSFSSILVPQQGSINAVLNNDYITLAPGTAIGITTDTAKKQVVFTNKGLVQIAVAGQNTIDTTITGSTALNVVSGTGISLTTNNTTNSLTIASKGVSLTTQDNVATTSTSFNIVGANGILTSTANGIITITNAAAAVYNTFADITGNTAAATLTAETFTFVGGSGISAVVQPNNQYFGNSLYLTNTGVLSIGYLTGQVSDNQLVTLINSASSLLTVNILQTAMNYFMSSR